MCFKDMRLILFTGFTAWPVEGRRRGQYTCFLSEPELGLRTKQGEEACCYDVSSFSFVSLGLGCGEEVGWFCGTGAG